jgi:hypothetical protein
MWENWRPDRVETSRLPAKTAAPVIGTARGVASVPEVAASMTVKNELRELADQLDGG